MAVLKKIKSDPDVVEYFKDPPFYNKHIKKPKVNRLKTLICFLNFLFMKNWTLIKTDHAFKGYAISNKVKLAGKKDPIKQLDASKSSIKDLFSGKSMFTS